MTDRAGIGRLARGPQAAPGGGYRAEAASPPPGQRREDAYDHRTTGRGERRRVGAAAAAAAAPAAAGGQARPRPPADPQRHPVEAADGGALAGPAGAVRPLVDGGLPLPALAAGRGLGPPVRGGAAGG